MSVCNSAERLLHEKKGLFHKMTRVVPLSGLWACTVPHPEAGLPPLPGQCPARGPCTHSPGIFSPPSCPSVSSRAAGVFTRREEDGRLLKENCHGCHPCSGPRHGHAQHQSRWWQGNSPSHRDVP